MSISEKTKNEPDDLVIQGIMKDSYQKGWNARKEFDSGLIEEAIRRSQDFEEFSRILREQIAKEVGSD